MNTRSKGRIAENEYAKILEDKGYTVQKVKGTLKFNKNVDFFGIFDLIAFNKEEWLLVQVKTNQTRGFKKIFNEWLANNPLPPNTSVILAVRYDRKPENERWKEYKLL